MTIAYNHVDLEELAGGHIKPLDEDDRIGRSAARTVCDFHLSTNPEDAMGNARSWIEIVRREAYNEGFLQGMENVKKTVTQNLFGFHL